MVAYARAKGSERFMQLTKRKVKERGRKASGRKNPQTPLFKKRGDPTISFFLFWKDRRLFLFSLLSCENKKGKKTKNIYSPRAHCPWHGEVETSLHDSCGITSMSSATSLVRVFLLRQTGKLVCFIKKRQFQWGRKKKGLTTFPWWHYVLLFIPKPPIEFAEKTFTVR